MPQGTDNPSAALTAPLSDPEAWTLGNRPRAKEMAIRSLGTAEVKRSHPYHEAKNWGALEWAKPAIDTMMSGVSETVRYQLTQIYDAVGVPDQYLRLQPRLGPENAALDNVASENLVELREIGTQLAERHADELDALVKLLVEGSSRPA